MRLRTRRARDLLIGGLGVVVGLVGNPGRATAEPSADDKALATMLFHEGRALMASGKIPDACLKLQESQRLYAAGGTLLNLALCHEQEGRLARSWSEFKEAAAVARRDGRRDREVEATNHVASLEPRLSQLTIVVPAEAQVEGLLIERDGHELGRGAWSMAIPVDGGEHVVRATALGREPFVTTFVMDEELDARTVEIPVLAMPVVVVTPPRAPALAGSPAPPAPPLLTAARVRGIGIGAAVTGAVLLGAAGYELAKALGAKDASTADCFSDGCGPTGLARRHDAVDRGNLATWLGIGGVVLVGAGAAVYYRGHRIGLGASRGAVAATIEGGL